jgi:hypothetical protein
VLVYGAEGVDEEVPTATGLDHKQSLAEEAAGEALQPN